jgi:hypothetical protein
MSLSILAYNIKRVLNILGVKAMIETLACNRLLTSLRRPKNRTSNLQVNHSHLALDREFRRLLTVRILLSSRFARKVFTQSGRVADRSTAVVCGSVAPSEVAGGSATATGAWALGSKRLRRAGT